MRSRTPDALALVSGMLAVLVGAGVLWLLLGGTPTTSALRVAVPLALVVVGTLGLAASRSS